MTSNNNERRSIFRPCIDLHNGLVKQIVGGTLNDNDSDLKTNYVSKLTPAEFAKLYKDNDLRGGHVIKLGPGNDEAARSAVHEWKNGLHVGGGITDENALKWIEEGAEKVRVIVTSYLFPNGNFSLDRLKKISESVGKDRLVVDISCRRRDNKWIVAMNKWQTLTDMEVNEESIQLISSYCSELLIHAADVEGLCKGIDEELVKKLSDWVNIPTTYAGGAKHLNDLNLINELSKGKIDLTYGSSLNIFGGDKVRIEDLIDWNKINKQ